MGSLKPFQKPTEEKITLIMFLIKKQTKIIFMGILILGTVFFKNLLRKKIKLIAPKGLLCRGAQNLCVSGVCLSVCLSVRSHYFLDQKSALSRAITGI